MRPNLKIKSTEFHAGLALPAIGEDQPVLCWGTLMGRPKIQEAPNDGMLYLLRQASEKGVPIPLRMWMSAALINTENLYELVVSS